MIMNLKQKKKIKQRIKLNHNINTTDKVNELMPHALLCK